MSESGLASEIVVFAQDDLMLWHARRPGYSIFGAYTGRVLLTSARLLFLSTGGSGAARRLLVSVALGPIGSLALGQTPTSGLDLRALESEGSVAIPLGNITDHGAQRRCDCATYVSVQYRKEGDTISECSFMPKNSVLWSGAMRWAATIDDARKAFASSPYR
jgi:hypothetical protein